MAWLKATESVYRMVDGFYAASSVSEEVFLYHRFGRYQETFPEKLYFLLSHCVYTLFSLWQTEEESEESLFRKRLRPTAFLADVGFDALRYADYKRRMLHADSLENHWNNETQWFKFWIQILEHLDPRNATEYQEFSRQVLAYVATSCVLQEKKGSANAKAFSHFIRTDSVGHVLLHTLAVFDELMRRIVVCMAELDPKIYLLDQLSVLKGVLGKIRQTIIYQTPARGPYMPLRASHWRHPSRLSQLVWGRTKGMLTVIPKRGGKDILCTYSPQAEVRGSRRCWTLGASSLPRPYEQELFATWSYETGEYCDISQQGSDSRACWELQYEEAGNLEALSQLIDILLDTLRLEPACKSLIEEIRSVARNGKPRWSAMEIPWAYVHQLDRLLDKLTLVRREAKAMAGYDVAQRILASLWPSRKTTACGHNSTNCRDTGEVAVSVGEAETSPSLAQEDPQKSSPMANPGIACELEPAFDEVEFPVAEPMSDEMSHVVEDAVSDEAELTTEKPAFDKVEFPVAEPASDEVNCVVQDPISDEAELTAEEPVFDDVELVVVESVSGEMNHDAEEPVFAQEELAAEEPVFDELEPAVAEAVVCENSVTSSEGQTLEGGSTAVEKRNEETSQPADVPDRAESTALGRLLQSLLERSPEMASPATVSVDGPLQKKPEETDLQPVVSPLGEGTALTAAGFSTRGKSQRAGTASRSQIVSKSRRPGSDAKRTQSARGSKRSERALIQTVSDEFSTESQILQLDRDVSAPDEGSGTVKPTVSELREESPLPGENVVEAHPVPSKPMKRKNLRPSTETTGAGLTNKPKRSESDQTRKPRKTSSSSNGSRAEASKPHREKSTRSVKTRRARSHPDATSDAGTESS